MKARIKKNDSVVVLCGRDKGEQGTVIEILPKKDKVMIKGLGMVTRHTKARRQGEVSGIKTKETFFKMSQVMPICSSCKKATRVATKVMDNGKRARACNHCKEIM